MSDEERARLDREIVDALRRLGPLPRALIAKELGRNAEEGRVELALRNLFARGVVEPIGTSSSLRWRLMTDADTTPANELPHPHNEHNGG